MRHCSRHLVCLFKILTSYMLLYIRFCEQFLWESRYWDIPGFVAKVYVLRNLFAESNFLWLGVVAIINTVISLYYYFKIVRAMYFMKNDELVVQNCNPILFWSIIIFSLQNIIFYIYWPNLIESLNMILINTGMF